MSLSRSSPTLKVWEKTNVFNTQHARPAKQENAGLGANSADCKPKYNGVDCFEWKKSLT